MDKVFKTQYGSEIHLHVFADDSCSARVVHIGHTVLLLGFDTKAKALAWITSSGFQEVQ